MDELSARLAASASSWVPQYFPNGRISDDRREWRLANINGDPPRKTGSCVIGLEGEMSGCWKEFDGGDGGGPLSTLKHASGKDGRELLDLAAELAGTKGDPALFDREAPRSPKVVKPARDPAPEIAHILARSVPLAGTLAETYLKSRGLLDPLSEDLRFCANVTDWKAGMGRPAMIAIPRLGDGTPTGGIHRTFLAYDGSAKADMERPKKMLGAMEGGAVRLMPMDESGLLGIAEGIETAIAAAMLYRFPVWAATSAMFLGGTDRAGTWIGFSPPAGLKGLYIFCDAGEAGFKAASDLLIRMQAIGIPAIIIEPTSGDDFNADLQAEPDAQRTLPDLAPALVKPQIMDVVSPAGTAEEIAIAIGELSRQSKPADLDRVVTMIALHAPDMLTTTQMIRSVKDRTKLPLKAIDQAVRVKRQDASRSTLRSPGEGWMAKMLLNDSGEPRALLENAATVLELAPEFAGVLWFDQFTNRPMMRRPAPWDQTNGSFTDRPWNDDDDAEATRWLQRAGVPTPVLLVHDAAMTVAIKSSYHPVREYLDGLNWDGEPRLDHWAQDFLGVDETPYTMAVCARWMMSAVARVMTPGIKVDHVLILEGPQGTYKSTALRALFDPWFSDDPVEIGTKDASIQLSGIWCLEYADLDRFGRADRNRLKAFITRQSDRYRAPYSRYAADYPRQLIFAATTNESSFLDDPTGGRRFWPLQTTRPDPDGLYKARDQLWAEAVARYRGGQKFYLVEPELQAAAAAQQRKRQHEDAWGSTIQFILEGKGEFFPRQNVTVPDILKDLGLPMDRWTPANYNRVRDYLQFIGWTRDEDVDNLFRRPG